ncbi:hypothetical protein T07_5490 [Trichinella nelsoni]|uniref:Uncharacterized protein n=1 Tax=Trichinella nelsoni TaxID=6336 RepID=A0A0V0RNP4_9BILA|nr:hypothetical protein T07_5490 [Trichinella nelsoni]
MRFSFTIRTLVQYFLVLGNSIFLHFWSISIKLIKVVSLRFWKFLRQINAYVSNKWPLKLPCAYLNAQETRPPGTPLFSNVPQQTYAYVSNKWPLSCHVPILIHR